MFKKLLSLMLTAATIMAFTTGCQNDASDVDETEGNTDVVETEQSEAKTPKYVFMFIGDGMSPVQINAAQVYKGNNTYGEIELGKLNFTQFPVAGMVTTQDSTSFAPDSASTATSLSSGYKTHSGVIGLEADKETSSSNIAELLKEQGMKIGIVSSVTINHATPAAYYAHVASRNDYYEIALQMAASDFDYFAGGAISQATGKEQDQKDAYEILGENGYTYVNTKEDILALNSTSGKVYAEAPNTIGGAMQYEIDAEEGDVTLATLVEKGIDVLDNEDGFFMMVEGGKIDWTCHANDAMTSIMDTIALDNAVKVAMDFAAKYPEETLILVTGDHETGGMTIGYATTGYDTAFDILSKQTMSYEMFDILLDEMKEANPSLTFEDMLPVVKENFGLLVSTDSDAEKEENANLVLTDYEYKKLVAGFNEWMTPDEDEANSQELSLLYGGYNAFSVSLTHILNNKAGIGWTSYSHTGTPVAMHAMGASAEEFGGYYDNTEVFHKLVEVLGLK
ncbi:MAG TPA: alkaline phosphatase [Firmicutes bacterium]|nr:alkaline phosphatase [Bacillota bacterium]